MFFTAVCCARLMVSKLDKALIDCLYFMLLMTVYQRRFFVLFERQHIRMSWKFTCRDLKLSSDVQPNEQDIYDVAVWVCWSCYISARYCIGRCKLICKACPAPPGNYNESLTKIIAGTMFPEMDYLSGANSESTRVNLLISAVYWK